MHATGSISIPLSLLLYGLGAQAAHASFFPQPENPEIIAISKGDQCSISTDATNSEEDTQKLIQFIQFVMNEMAKGPPISRLEFATMIGELEPNALGSINRQSALHVKPNDLPFISEIILPSSWPRTLRNGGPLKRLQIFLNPQASLHIKTLYQTFGPFEELVPVPGSLYQTGSFIYGDKKTYHRILLNHAFDASGKKENELRDIFIDFYQD